jgi:hypothetical protein
MSSIAVPGATNNPSNAVQSPSAVKPAPDAPAAATTANLKQDTVKLSLSAQIKSMHHQGLSPALIAAQLGTSVVSVDGYLGVKVAAQAPAPASDSTPAPKPASTPETGSAEQASASSSAEKTTATEAASPKS